MQKRGFVKGLLTFKVPKEDIFAANALFCKQNAAKLSCALIFMVTSHLQISNISANE